MATLARAEREGKWIIVTFGGEWCHRLDAQVVESEEGSTDEQPVVDFLGRWKADPTPPRY